MLTYASAIRLIAFNLPIGVLAYGAVAWFGPIGVVVAVVVANVIGYIEGRTL